MDAPARVKSGRPGSPFGGEGSGPLGLPARMEPQSSAPPVVVVVVSCDPGPWFEPALASLAAQDYPNLSVLVVDAASQADPSPRVAKVLPRAFVRRLPERVSFAEAANQALEIVEGAAFFLLCHDDVAFDPPAVRLMVEEAFRSNAGLVCPKVVEWDHPDHLLAVGVGADRFGVLHSLVEPGELDQEQWDAVQDVFVAPAGATLIRADLFAAMGGFDRELRRTGEDLDLSWRAHLVGARVIVAPAARVRHRHATVNGRRAGRASLVEEQLAGQAEENRLRTMVVCTGLFRLLWLLPVAALLLGVTALGQLLRGRPAQATATTLALPRAFRQPRRLWAAHRRAQKQRRVSDSEIGAMQTHGLVRFTELLERRISATSYLRQANRPDPATPPELAASGTRRPNRIALAVAVGLLIVLAIGTRGLLDHELPAIGQIPMTSDGPLRWWRAWWSSWQPAGLGTAGAASPALGILGVLGFVLFGAVGTLQHVVTLGPLLVGPLGAYWAARPFGSPRARAVAVVSYASIPVAYNALATGRWDGLLAYAAAPWILAGLARLTADIPFPSLPPRRSIGRVVSLGLLVGLVGSAVPVVLLIVPAIGLAMGIGGALTGRVLAGVRSFAVGVAVAAVGVIVLFPWSLKALGSPVATFGLPSNLVAHLTLTQLLRFQTGPTSSGVLGWAFLAAAALPLVIGRSWRLAWAGRLWMVALGGWAVAWLSVHGALPSPLAVPEVPLAFAAAALAGSTALGVAAFELDLPRYRLGWRQAAAAVAGLAVVVGVIPVLAATGNGRWHLPTADASSALAFFPSDRGGDYRVLWVGDPGALPMASWRYSAHVGYATSVNGLPDLDDTWLPGAAGPNRRLATDLRLAAGHRTTQLGHLLAPLAVRYIVVPSHLGPSGSGARAVPVPTGVLKGLAFQTDLQAVVADPAYTVYLNAAWMPGQAVLSARSAAAAGTTSARSLQRVDLSSAKPVFGPVISGAARASGRVRAGFTIVVASPFARGWRLRIDGRVIRPSSAFGWALRFVVPASLTGTASSARAVLEAPTSHLAPLLEVLLWALALVVMAVDLRRRYRRGAHRELVDPSWFAPSAPRAERVSDRSRSGVGDMDSDEMWSDV